MKKARVEKLKETKGICECCGKQGNQIHHIDESKDNHRMDNLLIVCKPCHTILHSKEKNYEESPIPSIPLVKTVRLGAIGIHEAAKILGISVPTIISWLKDDTRKLLVMEALENPEKVDTLIKPLKWKRNTNT